MWKNTHLAVAILAVMHLPGFASTGDYARVARLSYLEGRVSFQHPNEVDWADASINLALQSGDRIYTSTDGRAEIEFDDGSVLRLAEQTDIELTLMNDELTQIRVMVGLCTLTRHGDAPIDVSTPTAMFHTLRAGVYRFDVTETGATDGIVRKGSMQASGVNFSRQVGKGELIHAEAGDQAAPVISKYERRDGWDEWTDRRTADQVAQVSSRYVPDYVYAGVSDLDRYGYWAEIETYGYGWVPFYAGAGWSPYWDGRWCYRPYWGWTWVSYEPWGWLPYHYGSWYFSTGYGWCWLPGPKFGFHFWSPGLVRFYSGPGWVSWVPLGPGDYYNVHNYCYRPRYGHYLNDMRMVQRRGPDELINRHVPGAFRTQPTNQFVDGVRPRGAGAPAVVDLSQPWRDGRVVKDRLDVAPTSRSYYPAISSQRLAGRTEDAASPPPRRSAGSPGATESSISRVVPARTTGAANPPHEVERSVDGTVAVDSVRGNGVNPNSSAARGRTAADTDGRPIRIWNRVDETSMGAGASRTAQPAAPVAGGANPRSREVNVDGQDEVRGRAGPAQAGPPGHQRFEDRTSPGIDMRDNGRAGQPSVAVPDRIPSNPRTAPRPNDENRSSSSGRWQSSGGRGATVTPGPSWDSGRTSQAVRSSGPSPSQSPAWGRGGAQPATSSPAGPPRNVSPGGGAATPRGREH